MPYTFDDIILRDAQTGERAQPGSSVTIFAPGDDAHTPLVLLDPSGGITIPNPIIATEVAGTVPFMHDSLTRVAWTDGTYSGFLTSYEGMLEQATAAAGNADASRMAAQAAAETAAAPADEAIAAAFNTEGSDTRIVADARYASRDETSRVVGLTDTAVNIYVDAALGADTNDGSVNAQFKTIQAAFDSIPKVINKDRFVVIADGDYDEEAVLRGITGANIGVTASGVEPTDVTLPTGVRVRNITGIDVQGRILIWGITPFNSEALVGTAPFRFSRCSYFSLRSSHMASNTKELIRATIDADASTGTVNLCHFNDQDVIVRSQNGSNVKVYSTNTHGPDKSNVALEALAADINKDGQVDWAFTGAVTPERVATGGRINNDTWRNWAPTLNPYGKAEFAVSTIALARYEVNGRTCRFTLRATVTMPNDASPSSYIEFSLPVPSYVTMNAALGTAIVNEGGYYGAWAMIGNATKGWIRKSVFGSTYAAGASVTFFVEGSYETAA